MDSFSSGLDEGGATHATLEGEAFLEAVRTLDLIQDQLDWADVKSSWKSAAARWAKQLRKCRYPADLDLLWKLAGELMKGIKPTNFTGGWLVNADGSELTRYRQWLTGTDASRACAILKAVRVLRAHLVRVVDGPLYALDGTPLADAAHASAAPAPLASEPVMRSQTMIPVPAVGPGMAEGEGSMVQPNHAVTLANRWLVQEMSNERLAEEAELCATEVEEHSSASAPCHEQSMREAPAAVDYMYAEVLAIVEDDSAAAKLCATEVEEHSSASAPCHEQSMREVPYEEVLAIVEDDSAAAAQPWCIGGSVPGESTPTEMQFALSVSDEDASEEAVAFAEEASQLSVDGDAHFATTEGIATGAAYGSQVEVDANGVAESADGGRYTTRLAKACDLCHENRLKCIMLPTGWCEQCTMRGIECKRRMERKRGRPRVTAENIVQLVQRRTAKQQLASSSWRVPNSVNAIGAGPSTGPPYTGAFPSFHDPIQAAYAAGVQAATQAQLAAAMVQYHGPAHTFSHMPPVSFMAPHGVQPFGAPAHQAPQHPAFGGAAQAMFNGAAMAAMAGQYGVGGMDGSAAYEHYAAMYAHFQQQQQQQSPPPGYSGYDHQSAYNPSAVAAAAAAAYAAAQASGSGAALLAPDTPSTEGPAGHAHASSDLLAPPCMPAPAVNASTQPWVFDVPFGSQQSVDHSK